MENKNTPTPQVPKVPLTNPEFEYVPSMKTDITKTWRKFGWVPLKEKK